jgi:hypothetical protein
VHRDRSPTDRHALGDCPDVKRDGGKTRDDSATHGITEGVQRGVYVSGSFYVIIH